MALPFKNPISQCLPGFGSPSNNGVVTQTATATGTFTLTIGTTTTTPSAGGTAFNVGGGPAPSSGKWHMRIVNATTTATVTIEVRVSDGTNTWVISAPQTAYTMTTGYLDVTNEFKTDISITSVIAIVVAGGTVTSLPIDFEVSMTS